MPKKRVKEKKRKPGGRLTEEQVINLLGYFEHSILPAISGSMEALLSKGIIFESEEARRQAWEENRDRLFYLRHDDDKGLVEREAYTRPAAWWNYEAPEPKQEDETEREYLIRLGLGTAWDQDREREPLREYTEEEQREMVLEFIRGLDLKREALTSAYKFYAQGEKPFHDKKEWPEHVKEAREQASFLAEHAAGGKAALETWEELEAEIIDRVDSELMQAQDLKEAREDWKKKKKKGK